MPKAHAILAGSGVGTPAVRTFLDLDSTTDGGALLHALWQNDKENIKELQVTQYLTRHEQERRLNPANSPPHVHPLVSEDPI